jgi:prolyl 4-hydroxylase
MKVSEFILTIKNALSSEECQSYIALTEQSGYEAATLTTRKGFVLNLEIRNNERVIIDDFEIAKNLWLRVADKIPPILEGRQALGLNERFRFYRYDVGQYFAPHVDGAFYRDNGEQSLLTFMIYLNEEFEGGETNFGETCIKPETGMVLIFDHGLLHEGCAVTKGRKYALRSDVMYGRIGFLTSNPPLFLKRY